MENFSKEIIVYKLYSQANNPTLGYLKAVAEKNGDSYTPLNAENFCPSEKVFVTRDYEEIDRKYKDFELFKVSVIKSQFPSEDSRPEKNCKYVTKASEASSLKPRDIIEIVPSPLPNPNTMEVDVTNIPGTEYIYINDDGTCYGPFKWNDDSDNKISLKKIDSPMPGRQLTPGSIYLGDISELKNHIFYYSNEESERLFFKNLTDLHNDTHLVATDFSSDEDIVSGFVKLAKDMNFNSKKIDLAFLEANVKKHPKYNHKSLTEKLSKVKDISDTQLLFRNDVMDGFGRFLRSELGEKITEKYIEDNKDVYLSDIRDNYGAQLESEFRDKTADLKNLKEKIETNRQELISLGQNIEERNKIKISANTFDTLKESSDLDHEIGERKEQLNNLNQQIKPLLEKYTEYNSLDELEKKLVSVKAEYRFEMRQRFEIEDEIKKLEALYKENEDKLRTKLFELKPFVEAINGNVGIPHRVMSKNVSQEVMPINKSSNTAQDILEFIKYSLREEDRFFSILDVINITVTLQQSFICFLAGLPGGGKTTLARLVAKVYGIQDHRFLDVPVARGWTGQRDLIGFFNPISNKFQSSNTGLYEFLCALSEESKDKDLAVPISLVLLDEANLSPIEHYWSSFMGLTDSMKNKELILGDDYIKIPENLRFILTINYDSTTEALSPRLIDRSPIIVLEPNASAVVSEQEFDKEPSIKMPISYEVMEHYFGKTKDKPEFIENERRVYDNIKKILEARNIDLGKPIIISKRKEEAIKQYCNRARPLMREFSTDDELLALDYAVLQLILPLLRGYGKSFSKRLEQLKDILSEYELDRSGNYLDNIIINGNADLYTYDFFCW